MRRPDRETGGRMHRPPRCGADGLRRRSGCAAEEHGRHHAARADTRLEGRPWRRSRDGGQAACVATAEAMRLRRTGPIRRAAGSDPSRPLAAGRQVGPPPAGPSGGGGDAAAAGPTEARLQAPRRRSRGSADGASASRRHIRRPPGRAASARGWAAHGTGGPNRPAIRRPPPGGEGTALRAPMDMRRRAQWRPPPEAERKAPRDRNRGDVGRPAPAGARTALRSQGGQSAAPGLSRSGQSEGGAGIR